MRPKHLLLTCISLVFLSHTSQAQILKKIKNKVNKTLNSSDSNSEKEETDKTSSENNQNSTATTNDDSKSAKWCEGLDATGGGSGNAGGSTKDGVEYKKAYSSANGFTILYDESSLGLNNDSKGFRLVLSERVNNKNQFVLVENGKVVATNAAVKPEWLSRGSSQTHVNDQDADREEAMKKYIVGDTMKHNVPKSDAKSVTVQKVDDDQMEMALQVARQSDDYKNMSEAEKKEFEETVRAGIAKNNTMAGTTVNVPAQQGGTVAMVNGYFLVVKGKKLGKFNMPPLIDVSKDEKKVFAVGINEDGVPVMLANGKKTLLDQSKYSAMMGRIVRSPDQKKFVYLEQKKMSEKELADLTTAASSNQRTKLLYNVIKGDGSTSMVTDHNYSGKFKLTNSGALVNMNEETGEVFADNKLIGKFPLQSGDRLNPDAVLIGSDISQVAYYNGNEGSFTYLDGTVKKLDIIFPRVISEGGKSYLSWFRKCGKDIYIAQFAY